MKICKYVFIYVHLYMFIYMSTYTHAHTNSSNFFEVPETFPTDKIQIKTVGVSTSLS